MSSSPQEVKRHVKGYWIVGLTLCAFTVITFMIGAIPAFDLGAPGTGPSDIALGLAIATFKCSLVVLVFMHLNHERGLIYKMLVFTMVFAAALMALTLFAQSDPIRTYSDVVDRVSPNAPAAGLAVEGGTGERGKGH